MEEGSDEALGQTEKIITSHPIRELYTYLNYGENPSFSCTTGLGKISAIGINMLKRKERGGRIADLTETRLTDFKIRLHEIDGALVLDTGGFEKYAGEDSSINTEEFLPWEISLDMGKAVQGFEDSAKRILIGAQITSELKSNHGQDYDVTIKEGNYTIHFSLAERNGHALSPHIRMFLDNEIPLEDQLIAYIKISNSIMQALQETQDSAIFTPNPDSQKDFLASIQKKLEELHARIPVENLAKAHMRKASMKEILSQENPSYQSQYPKLEEKREKMMEETLEPQFQDVRFPYQEMAAHDFKSQPYLTPEESENITTSLARVIADEGGRLTERVVKEHYAYLVRTKRDDGSTGYDILTTPRGRAISRESIEIGVTHEAIRFTREERERRGANYNSITGWGENDFDSRGVIFETINGKYYAVWDLPSIRSVLDTKGAVGLSREYVLDPKLLKDFEDRYKIAVLTGNAASSLFEQEVFNNQINLGILRYAEKKGKKMTNTQFIRSRLMAAIGLPFSQVLDEDN